MIIESYTYIYIFIIFVIGLVWAIIMILLEKRKLLKKESTYNKGIIDYVINNNNSVCINDYEIKNVENIQNSLKLFDEFIGKQMFERIIKEGEVYEF